MILNRPKDIFSGLVFAAIGVFAFASAQSYEIGSLTHMGPGFLPAAAGLLLVGTGIALVVKALRLATPEPIDHHDMLPLVLILAGVIAFAMVIEPFGLIPAIFVLVVLSCGHRLRQHPVEVLAIFVALSLFCSLLFVQFLGQNLSLFW